MKITLNNYFDLLDDYRHIIESNIDLTESHNLLVEATESGQNHSAYDLSKSIKEVIDLYLEKLNALKNKKTIKTAAKTVTPPKKQANPQKNVEKPKEKTVSKSKERATTAKPALKKKIEKEPDSDAEKVEHIPSDIALVKRYISLHDKQKTYDQVLAIWKAFNKAIVERKITKDSPYKSEIEAMNSSLKAAIPAAEGTGALHMVIPTAKLKAYKAIAESVEKSAGVAILLEYINISGRPGMVERADKLNKRIDRAMQAGKLQGDRYLKDIKSAQKELESYINKETNVIAIDDYNLSGIGEVAVFGCSCSQSGIGGFTSSQNAVIYKLIDEKVKNLRECELDRAFADTVAPSICKAIAQRLIDGRQLNMSLIRNPAKSIGARSLNGSGKVPKYDYNTEILDMRLRNAGAKSKPTKEKSIRGLDGFGTTILFPDAPATEVKIMSAKDLVQQKFRTIGLQGKYRKLIGDPEPGFSAMIYGKPKQGKSTVAIDFAKELTSLGRVLYCAFEEGHGYTLQDKVKRNNADVPGLDFANRLPQNLSPYRYVFIDSVSDAKLDENAFGTLVKANKAMGISVLGVFHATKNGNFRGGQGFAHDVDVLIRVEDGIAYAQGRYAPPGELSIAAIIPPTSAKAA